jgi:uncharacterized protein YgiM (DUF1202 family)
MQITSDEIKPFRVRLVVVLMTVIFTLSCLFSVSLSKVDADDTYKTWKQFDSAWGSEVLGKSGTTMAKNGCAVTALAMLCVHSGAVDEDGFDPGVFVNGLSSLNAFSSDGSITWSKVSSYTPYLSYASYSNSGYSSQTAVINAMKNYLNSGYYVLIRVNNSGSTHFVTLDYMTDDAIYMMDPGKTGAVDLFATYGYYNVTGVRLFTSSVGDSSSLITDGSEPKDPVFEENGAADVTNTTDSTASTDTTDATDATNATEETTVESIYSSANVVLNKSGDIISSDTTDYLAGTYTTIAALNLRSGASIDTSVLLTIPKNTKVNVSVTTIDGWGLVSYKNKTGWVCLRYVK